MPEPVSINSQYHRWLITAHPGHGKTSLLATRPKTLILRSSVDQIDSIFTMGLQDNVQEEIISSWSDMTAAYEFLRHEDHGFDWTWLDCYSLIQDELLQDVLDDVVSKKSHRDPDVPDKQEYLKNMKRFQTWLRDMSKVPINLGITAHPFRVEDEDDDSVMYYPWIQGKNMPEKVCGYMKLVAFLKPVKDKQGETHRVLITDPTDKFYAKDQYGAFGGKVVDPTVPKMEAMIKKAAEGKEPRVKKSAKRTTKKATTTKRTVAKKATRKRAR